MLSQALFKLPIQTIHILLLTDLTTTTKTTIEKNYIAEIKKEQHQIKMAQAAQECT